MFVMLNSVCQANERANICQSRGCRSGVGSLDQVLKLGRSVARGDRTIPVRRTAF